MSMTPLELAAALADAWDDGYDHGDPYQRRGDPEVGKAANPYRTRDEASDLALQRLRDRLTSDACDKAVHCPATRHLLNCRSLGGPGYTSIDQIPGAV